MAHVLLRTDLAEDLRVAHLVGVLGITDVDLLVGKLWRLWSLAAETTEEGLIAGASFESLDAALGMPGLCKALEAVGWLQAKPGGVEIANFDDANSRDERRRQESKKRQRKLRGKEPVESEPAAYQRNAAWPSFEKFWAVYPKKKSKFGAWRAWQKLRVNADPELLARILAAVRAQKHRPEWFKDNGKFIPYPATWLNAGGWEDLPDQAPPPPVPDESALRERIAAERRKASEEEQARSTKTVKRQTPAPDPAPVAEEYEDIPGFYEHYLTDE